MPSPWRLIPSVSDRDNHGNRPRFLGLRGRESIDQDEEVSGVQVKYCKQRAHISVCVVHIDGEESVKPNSTCQSHRVKSNQIYLQLLRLNRYSAKSDTSLYAHVRVDKNDEHSNKRNMRNGTKVILKLNSHGGWMNNNLAL